MSNSVKSATVDLTQGRIIGKLISFSIPFLVANVLQQLYSIIDMAIVGQFIAGSTGMSAVTVGCQAAFIMTAFSMGVATGGRIRRGRLCGRFFPPRAACCN